TRADSDETNRIRLSFSLELGSRRERKEQKRKWV
ncbi:unnamed protein product, partial [marine sediment metagenome]